MTDDLYDVAIVGWGPVGQVLAILLAQLGRRVAVLERWPRPYPMPRAVHFDDEVGRILQACGIGPALAAISEPAEVYEWRNGDGTTLLRFGRVGPGRSGWPQSSMFSQPELEARLDERAACLPDLVVHRGCEVTGIDSAGAEGDQRTVVLRSTMSDGRPVSLRARFAVGCDGANSTVRTLLGAPVHDLGFNSDWLIVDLVLHQERIFDPINVQVCDPRRPVTVASGGPGRRRWEFMRLPGETIEELGDEATAWRLLKGWDITPAMATLERHATYTFGARWVERWRTGNVFLAGDAAHQMPPFAGQGLGAGLRDVANLSWKLDLVLDGRAPDSLLHTYQEECAPRVRTMIDFSVDLGRIICVSDPEAAAERDAAMSGSVAGGEVSELPELPGLISGLRRRDGAHAGTLFVQGRVTTGGIEGCFDDAVGAGWRLVTRSDVTVEADEDLAGWFCGIGGVVVTVGSTAREGGATTQRVRALGDPDGTYRTWFAEHGVAAALQRPDFALYGTADSGADAVDMLAELRVDLRVDVGADMGATVGADPGAEGGVTEPPRGEDA